MCQCCSGREFFWLFKWTILWLVLAAVKNVDSTLSLDEDICGPYNGRRVYLELGEKGILHAENVSLTKNSLTPYGNNSSHEQCSLELVTCPSCIIKLTFKSINLLYHCEDAATTLDNPCRCDYVWISEPPYEDVSGQPFCGYYAPIVYRSSTRTVSISLLYSQFHKNAFVIEYTSERNRQILKGVNHQGEISNLINNTSGGSLTSPFFPARYPRDLGMEYVISCPFETPTCRVRILFSDFQIAPVSIMEFYDWNGQRLDVSSGSRFRPPIIISTGPSLLIRFYANGATGLGYKAHYSFVLLHNQDKVLNPITDCGGYVENLGGAITMMDMVSEGVKTYDCVWLIKPPKSFQHLKTHMYLKIITFSDMAGNTELTVRQGPTSALMPLEVLRYPINQMLPTRSMEHIAPISNGFYVSLRGTFGPSSRLALSYTAFSYMDCYAGSDFLCQNHRCIPSQLNCDGLDHCGDNSDESSACLQDWDITFQDRKWQQSKPNYFFPKIERYPDMKTATFVFVASSIGLIAIITTLIVLLYRISNRARQQRELQSRLRTISELLAVNIADGSRVEEVSITTDDPPVYEAPPGYDECIKIWMQSNWDSRRKKYRVRNGHRSRSSPSRASYDSEHHAPLTVDPEEASSSTRGSRSSEATQNGIDNLSAERSPPPAYATPSSPLSRKFDYAYLQQSASPEPIPGPSHKNDESGENDIENSFQQIPSSSASIASTSHSKSFNSEANIGENYNEDQISTNDTQSSCNPQLNRSNDVLSCTRQNSIEEFDVAGIDLDIDREYQESSDAESERLKTNGQEKSEPEGFKNFSAPATSAKKLTRMLLEQGKSLISPRYVSINASNTSCENLLVQDNTEKSPSKANKEGKRSMKKRGNNMKKGHYSTCDLEGLYQEMSSEETLLCKQPRSLTSLFYDTGASTFYDDGSDDDDLMVTRKLSLSRTKVWRTTDDTFI